MTRSAPPPPAPPPASRRRELSYPVELSFCRWQQRWCVLAIGAILWLQRTEYFWRNPIADARFQTVTDFDGVEQAAAVSRDGHFVAFLSDRDGQMDVWVTQVGSGEFHNLTHGSAPELANPSIRTLGFSPDGSLVTFWVRKPGGLERRRHQHLGGAYAGRRAEAIPGRRGRVRLVARRLPARVPHARPRRPAVRIRRQPATGGPAHLHCACRAPQLTFPCGRRTGHSSTSSRGGSRTNWTSGASVQPAELPNGSRRTMARVSYPVLLDRRTLMYLASDPDGSGPWLYSMDVERRIPHRLTSGLDRYTSLAASADGRRLVATLATPKRTLWRLRDR